MNPIQPGASIQEMARSLMRTVDSNGNGELSTEEFTSFLAKLMTGVQTGLSASPTAVHHPGRDGGRRRDRRVAEVRGLRLQQGRRPGQVGQVRLRRGGAEGRLDADQQGRRRDVVQRQRQGRDGKARSKIDWVKGDKFQFTNWQGTFVVDYVRGAASSNPALAWQVE